MPSKPWYESKTMWSDIVTIGVSIAGLVDKYSLHGALVSNPYYSMALTVLGAIGLYSRATATATIEP